ncbi:tripartite tricarboxylate transporter TctB family protein [Comamonas aquatica]|uniref:tripartite tricarboxylate transporter TctB family protein n=1 Tax=Comamonas aquatica TaxID=225991 RepID=UPI001B37CC56|nr:tripartite tricarboxylate transporter TctB family protein [Comamonas aquatica]QTX19595.1 tripartite tricarboxylate transporter TctB family protein [Comamonas aquatica]
MLPRDLRDILAGLFVAAVGLFFAIAGSGYAMGSAARMGPGYMPVILGWVLFALGVLIVLPAWFRQGDRIVVHWDSLAASLGSLVVFAFLLNTLGVFFSTMVAVLVASLPKPMHMGMRLVIAGIIAVITVLIFIVGLNMTISMFPEF